MLLVCFLEGFHLVMRFEVFSLSFLELVTERVCI